MEKRVLNARLIDRTAIVICLIGLAYLMITELSIYDYNRRLEKNFSYNDQYLAYQDGRDLTLEELRVYANRYFGFASQGPEPTEKFHCLDTELHYYGSPDDHKPALVIEKDAETYPVPEMLIYWYGFFSYPTYKRGWRLTTPFYTREQVESGEPLTQDLYYIRIDELRQVLRKLLKLPHASDERKRVEEKILKTDWKLYESGCYLSPDLYRTYFPRSVPIIGTLCAVSLLICVCVKRNNRIK